MSFGPPIFGTNSTLSLYTDDISLILNSLPDNNNNEIEAKDVRNAVWSLYNYIQDLESISVTQSVNLYTLGTPSTVSVGGIQLGSTFSDISIQDIFDIMLTPQVDPILLDFSPSTSEVQFGSTTPISFNYSIGLGSELLDSISIQFPTGINQNITPSNLNPTTGTTNVYNPVLTYTTSATVSQTVIATMSYQTPTGTFVATSSVTYKHKRYYGKITLPGGFDPNNPISVSQVSNSINSSTVLGLSFSSIGTNVNFSQLINFNSSNQYFLFAAPTAFGFTFPNGFYVDNIFNQGFTKIKSSFSFTNEFGYATTYDVWISNNPYLGGDVLIGTNLTQIGDTQSIYSLLLPDSLWTVSDIATQSYTFSFLTNNQEYYGVSFSGTVDLYLPPLNDVMDGKVFVIKDESGFGDINVTPFLGETIDGFASSFIFTSPYESLKLIKNNNGWWGI
jgi:hypothetical protein